MEPRRLKQTMRKLGMSKRTFADTVGVSERTVEGWLSKRKPSKVAQKFIRGLLRQT
jgi:DNA-binding transcriptional regulator YiaG